MVHIVSQPKYAVQKPISVLLSLQKVQEEELAIAAENLSNAQTSGYKARILQTKEMRYHTKDHQKVSYVKVDHTARDLNQGSIKMTHDSFHLALSDEGYFAVMTPNGLGYTRDGRFMIDNNNQLVNSAGYTVMDQNGNTITIPNGSKTFAVGRTGEISIDGVFSGQIGVYTFTNEQSMKLAGHGLLKSDEEGTLKTSPSVVQGGYEESNVSPVDISMKLVNILHHFEQAQKMIDNYDARQRDVMNAKAYA